MLSYCLKIAPHYSGMMCAHFPDFPGTVVLGRDHQEATDLALAALEFELERQIEQNGKLPTPRFEGRLWVSTAKFE